MIASEDEPVDVINLFLFDRLINRVILEKTTMVNQFKWIVVSTAFLLSIPCLVVYGQNESEPEDASTIDLETVACRRLLKLGDSDQEATISFFQGFISGKNNELTADVVRLGEISEKVIDHCIDNPNDSLLQVFEQYRNN
jgi:hypothetical protein